MKRFLLRIAIVATCPGLIALALAGCAQTNYYDQPAARRCDRNGDIDERRAC
jgi:hypothetical protein